MTEQHDNKEYQDGQPLMPHAFDGIREYDNPIPLWLSIVFVLSIVFAIIYMPVYHIFNAAPLPLEVYEQDMAEANAAKQARAEAAAAARAAGGADVAAVVGDKDEGKEVYTTYCGACHGAQLEGLIGPNLKDDEWIHGNAVENIDHVIRVGIPDKGMPGWEAVLGDARIAHVIAYLQTENPGIGSGE